MSDSISREEVKQIIREYTKDFYSELNDECLAMRTELNYRINKLSSVDKYTEIFSPEQLNILAQARKIYGGKNQVTVAAEECCELAKELLKAIRYEDFNEAVVHTKKDVLAEVADVLIVIDHVLKLYNITASDLQPQIEYKLNRLQQWLNDSNSIEYTTELREI